ncbi:hypothetical protein PILCRDRAFT_298 [Piloderma croceum F 1598]|uniref:Major facilitator superfamily (MFS) profile domain-containing protein n=1 Tax=Piloderma croceum (strain F 1598) TaxID=765440 RepID=A0A0C3GKU9_PILCF|nr:hypothetical protein PILCRDRAFT_298 [Piloderma croceum F 1598]
MADAAKASSSDFAKPIETLNMSSTSLDGAAVYLHNHSQLSEEVSINPKMLLRKIDWRLMPLAFACSAVQFIDKFTINYAAVMGMNEDLKLVGNNFSNVATALFIATLIAEVPTGKPSFPLIYYTPIILYTFEGYILQKVPAGKWLGMNVILWGTAVASTAAVENYRGLLACRILLGVFEAAMPPCLMLITGMWYTKSEGARRFNIWFCGLGFSQIVGGLVSWGFQQFTAKSIAGWRLMFIVLGVLSIVVGLFIIILMPDNQMSAKWLSDAEKTAAIQRVAVNQTGIKNTHFKWSHLKELALDVQIWLLSVLFILMSISSGIIATYSATIIRNLGYSSSHSALLNMPGGLVSIASTLSVGYFVGRQGSIWLWISISCMPAVLGGALMSFLPTTNKGGLLVGMYLVNAVSPSLILIFSWVGANVAGHTKRVAASALVSAAFCIGSIIGPQTFQAKDAPQYIPAKITVLATQFAAIMVAVTARLYYGWQNSRRQKMANTTIKDVEWLNLTDKENPSFRYQY